MSAQAIAIVGNSGTGKSTSIGNIKGLDIQGLDPEHTLLINVKGKPLPFAGWKNVFSKESKNYFASSNPAAIIELLQRANDNEEIKYVVIDDAQYIMGEEFMRTALHTGFTKFSKLAKEMYDVINAGISLRDDMFVFFMFHAEETKDGYKIKTIGKMLDEKISIEGLFTVVLYSTVQIEGGKASYQFVTNYDGQYPAKSPFGMFENIHIPNDLNYVVEKVKNYNENG